jgi:hypothetical protein
VPVAIRRAVLLGQPDGAGSSWDGVPLDVDVALPPADQDGPFPLVIRAHGWSQGKAGQPFVDQARDGYVVLNYSARGFQARAARRRHALGSVAPRPRRLRRAQLDASDARYEGRDTQYLAGLLADEGLVIPDRIGGHRCVVWADSR